MSHAAPAMKYACPTANPEPNKHIDRNNFQFTRNRRIEKQVKQLATEQQIGPECGGFYRGVELFSSLVP